MIQVMLYWCILGYTFLAISYGMANILSPTDPVFLYALASSYGSPAVVMLPCILCELSWLAFKAVVSLFVLLIATNYANSVNTLLR